MTENILNFVEVKKQDFDGVEGLSFPNYATLSPDGKFLYTVSLGDSAVAVFGRDTTTGKLSFVEFKEDDKDGIDGLGGANSVSISPDGKFLYATGAGESAVAVFGRDITTGKLSFVEDKKSELDAVDGLGGVNSVTISPDGKFLYTAGSDDSAVSVFGRDTTTGKLSFVEIQIDDTDGVDGLDGANSITISPDGNFLYASGGNESAVAVFRRNTATGRLSFLQVIKDDTDGVDGLGFANFVTVNPNGNFLYASGGSDSAVAVFRRNKTTGKLSFVQVVKDDTDGVDGLSSVVSLTVSPDGKSLYAAGFAESAVSAFSISDNTQLLNDQDQDIFTIISKGDKARLKVELTGHSSQQLYELGVFTVDDEEGNIQGIAPGAAGYTEAALKRAKVIFSSLVNLPNGFNGDLSSLLEYTSGDQIRFYLVRNSTTDSILAGKAAFTDVLIADPTNVKMQNLGDNGFSLAWKDSSADFQDLVANIQATDEELPLGASVQGQQQGELIDLRNVTQPVKAEFKVNREARYNNYVGFYQVVDENGGIDTNADGKPDILVGQPGYLETAIRGRVAGIDLTVKNQRTATYAGTFEPGSIFAPFIIIYNTPDIFLDEDTKGDPAVYFPFLGANSDQTDHIRLLGNNTFGFEDLAYGGDRDFNDVIVRVNLSIT